MRQLLNFGNTNASSAPTFFVIVHDAELAVQSVLCEETLLTESGGVVYYNGVAYTVASVLKDLQVVSTKPQGLGSGLIRRTASFSVQSEDLTGYPYIAGVLSKAIWAGGQTVDSVIFSIWGIDKSKIASDIKTGICFGFYKVDSNSNWNENEGVSNFSLIDVTLNDEKIVGGNDQPGVAGLLSYNEDFNAKIIPVVYGAVPRIKMLRGYPNIGSDDPRIKTVDGKTNFNSYLRGYVAENYTGASTEIVLESPSFDSSPLRQLISSGLSTVTLRMSDGEVITGTLTYDDTNNKVKVTSATRHAPYYSGIAYSVALSSHWDNSLGITETEFKNHYDFWKYRTPSYREIFGFQFKDIFSTVLMNDELFEEFKFGYCSTSVDFAITTNTVATYNSYCKISDSGYTFQENGKTFLRLSLETDTTNGAYNTKTGWSSEPASLDIQGTGISSWAAFSYKLNTSSYKREIEQGLRINGNKLYAYYRTDSAYIEPGATVSLYWKDPSTTAGSGTAGTTEWRIISKTGAVSYNYYLANGYTSVNINNVYCVGEKGLIKIPAGSIAAFETGISEYDQTNLIRLKLSAPPIALNIGAQSNDIYIDSQYVSGSIGNDKRQIIYQLLSTSSMKPFLTDSNLKAPYTTANSSPYIGFVAFGETYSQLLDKIAFQLNSAVYWDNDGGLLFNSTVDTSKIVDTGSGGTTDWTGEVINEDQVYENTGSIQIGKIKTVKIDDYRDRVKVYFNAKYGGWMDPFYIDYNNKDSIGEDELYTEYKYDILQDKASATAMIDLAQWVGSATGYTNINRNITVVGELQLCKYEALDPVLLNRYPSITDDDSLTSIMQRWGDNDSIRYTNPSSTLKYLLQGFTCIEEARYNLSIGEASVVLTCRSAQYKVDARGVRLFDPPTNLDKAVANKDTKTNGPIIVDNRPLAQQINNAVDTSSSGPSVFVKVNASSTIASFLTASVTGHSLIYNGTDIAWGFPNPALYNQVTGPAVLARTASGVGASSWLQAATSGHVLTYNGTNIVWAAVGSTDTNAYSVLGNITASVAAATSIASTDGTFLGRVGNTLAFTNDIVIGTSASGGATIKAYFQASKYLELDSSGNLTLYQSANTSVTAKNDGTIINRRSGIDYSVCDVATITTSTTPPSGSGVKGQLYMIY